MAETLDPAIDLKQPSLPPRDYPTAKDALRHIRFLGFTHERFGEKPSFNELRKEFGDADVNRLVTQVGESLLAAHIESTHMPLNDAVSKVISQMTPEQRRDVARGQQVPQTLIAEAIGAADQASKQSRRAELVAAYQERRYTHDQIPLGMRGPLQSGSASSGGYSALAADHGAIRSETERTIAEARSLCGRLPGMEWAKNNPDILKLGPEALRIMHQAHMREDGFKALKGVGYEAKDVLAAAKFSVATGQNGNDVAHALADTNKEIATGPDGKIDPQMLARLKTIQLNRMNTVNDPNSQRVYDEHMGQIRKEHPEKAKPIDKQMNVLDKAVQGNAVQATTTASQVEATTSQKGATARGRIVLADASDAFDMATPDAKAGAALPPAVVKGATANAKAQQPLPPTTTNPNSKPGEPARPTPAASTTPKASAPTPKQ